MTTQITNNILAFDGGPLSGFRNRIINGDFRVAQRGTSGTVANTYSLDRWIANFSGTAATWSQGSAGVVSGTGISTFYVPNSFVFNGVTGNTAVSLYQRIEQRNMIDMTGQTVTISYWVFQTTASTMSVNTGFVYPTANDNFGSTTAIGSTASTSVPPSTWTKVTGTITIPTAATTGLQVQLINNNPALVAGQSLIIVNVQLELGTTATPFEIRPTGVEQLLCQRYYYQSFSGLIGTQYTATTVARATAKFPVTMRTIPTLGIANTVQFFNGATTSTATGSLTSYAGQEFWQADVVVGSVTLITGSCCSIVQASSAWTATAEL